MNHQMGLEDEREELEKNLESDIPVISVDEFYGFPGPSDKILKMVTSGNINEYFRHMSKQRITNQRADLLLHRIVSDKIRKNLQLVENGDSIPSVSATLKMAALIGPDVEKH